MENIGVFFTNSMKMIEFRGNQKDNLQVGDYIKAKFFDIFNIAATAVLIVAGVCYRDGRLLRLLSTGA